MPWVSFGGLCFFIIGLCWYCGWRWHRRTVSPGSASVGRRMERLARLEAAAARAVADAVAGRSRAFDRDDDAAAVGAARRLGVGQRPKP